MATQQTADVERRGNGRAMDRLGAMTMKRRERGFSFWSMMIYICFFGSVILLGLKLIPVYLESMKINNAVEALSKEGTAGMSPRGVKDSLLKQFDIDQVTTITFRNFEEFVTLTPKGNGRGYAIDIAYEREIPLLANVSLLVQFDKSVQ